MARQSNVYTQLAIGTCGHVVQAWPQVCGLGGSNPEVPCVDCTREKYGLEFTDELVMWVGLKPEPKKPAVVAKTKKPRKQKLSPFNELLRQEGLF